MAPVRVLHVENDSLVARAVARVLNRHGFATSTAESCGRALEVQSEFEVGVFDVDLDDGNGVGLAEELLLRGTVGNCVFFTGTRSHTLLARAVASGDVVPKEEGVDALVDQLKAILKGGPRRTQPRGVVTRSGFPPAEESALKEAFETTDAPRRVG